MIFGEDPAALLGLILALLAVATGNPIWAAIGTMVIGVLLIVVAAFSAVEVKAMLIGQSMDPLAVQEMRSFLEARPETRRVLNLISLQLGPWWS